jgi:hypothetical protein
VTIAIGLKAHSGWAALVALGRRGDALEVVDRRRIELLDRTAGPAPRQPYHAAENLEPSRARAVVARGIESARRAAEREVRAAIEREEKEGHRVAGCAVLVGNPMPAWSVDEILAVHFRMHKAEGVLYRDALAVAIKACGVRLVEVAEKTLVDRARTALGLSTSILTNRIAALGKIVGAPWGKDQKDAALAGWIVLGEETTC